MRIFTIGLALLAATACSGAAPGKTQETADSGALQAAITAPTRSAQNVARDTWRHPTETLAFFGVEPNHHVVEIWPGGGWYTEILAPYLTPNGKLSLFGAERQLAPTRKKVAANPATYGAVAFIEADPVVDLSAVPEATADVVLTFRNVHNWQMGGTAYGPEMFDAMFRMLKPGGTLGVVEHRLPEGRPDADMKTSGYMKQSAVVKLAQEAGFELVETSEINANPKDDANHPAGVWSLPPTYNLGDQDRAKYAAIGESDRMTLKFRKPR